MIGILKEKANNVESRGKNQELRLIWILNKKARLKFNRASVLS